MKIAVTASGTELSDRFDTRFGRAANFIVYDLESEQWECHTNKQNYDAVQGAGIQAAQTVSRLGVSALVTGHVGPKAFKVLQASGIKAFAAEAVTAMDALGAFRRGELTEMTGPDVEGHWL
ncbi:MAG: NifB/NifX family molybdenum-iron cluster-binding protein [Sporomusaceae bacterium]|nr:NifB/NifX family molybdenum-iron cluster-binding protein [Sporomusaceae bacterium]